MTIKLIIIALVAASFGWGFSALVENKDQTMRSENARVACQDWDGDGCGQMFER